MTCQSPPSTGMQEMKRMTDMREISCHLTQNTCSTLVQGKTKYLNVIIISSGNISTLLSSAGPGEICRNLGKGFFYRYPLSSLISGINGDYYRLLIFHHDLGIEQHISNHAVGVPRNEHDAM